MPDLEEKIAAWRRQMAAGGIKTPAVLDELESHLREDVERQLQSGLNEERAVAAAVERIGRSDLLKVEFTKVAGTKETRPGKVIGMACCLISLPFSILAVPNFLALRELSASERILGSMAVTLTFFSIASWRFSHKYLPAIRNRRVRSATAIGCGLLGLAWLCIFGILLPTVLVPYFFGGAEAAPTDRFTGVFAMGDAILWAMALTAMLGGIAYGLEETARRRTQENAYV